MQAQAKGVNCWVCFFDCFPTKRQFYYYSKDELKTLFKNSSIYGQGDESLFTRDYKLKTPEVVFIQNISPKTHSWFPITNNSKVVHLSYYDESKHLKNPLCDVHVSLLHDEKYSKYYSGYNIKYLGNYRLDNFIYVKRDILKENLKPKCFIVESYIRKKDLNDIDSEVAFYSELFDMVRESGFDIVWKKREKGYPSSNWGSPLDLSDSLHPDVIIEKDCLLPSSIFHFTLNSDLCLVINDSFAFFDFVNVNPNSYILKSSIYNRRKYKFDEGWFSDYDSRIIDLSQLKKKISGHISSFDYELGENASEHIVNCLLDGSLI